MVDISNWGPGQWFFIAQWCVVFITFSQAVYERRVEGKDRGTDTIASLLIYMVLIFVPMAILLDSGFFR
jgi:hypothetical protein